MSESAPIVCSDFSIPSNATVTSALSEDHCNNCSSHLGCFWCSESGICASQSQIPTENCTSGWCTGDSCEDVCLDLCGSMFPCSKNIVGMVILILLYGLVLAGSAKMIADGSDMLLEIFPDYGTVIGALLLPILGAIPDAAIILVSGAFGPVAEAQEQVAVGMGTLAGSTIMLLTVPWAASIWAAKCDLDVTGEAIDTVCTSKSLTKTGVTVDNDTMTNARIAIVTSIMYFVVQGVAFAHLKDPGAGAKLEEKLAVAGMTGCFAFLVAYCVYQIWVPKLAQKRMAKVEREREERNMRLRAYHIAEKLGWMVKSPPSINSTQDPADSSDAKALAFGRLWKSKADQHAHTPAEEEKVPLVEKKLEEVEEEEVEPPFWKTLLWALVYLIVGTGFVAFFSDPMVDVISNFGRKINIGAFYVSFIVTPYCSNASELVSSLIFASKKRKSNSSMTFSQLYGAATMNNTLGLGIFFALVYFRKLTWTFSAETLSIFTITVLVGSVGAFKTTFKTWWMFPIIALYPLSLVFVWLLESQAGWT